MATRWPLRLSLRLLQGCPRRPLARRCRSGPSRASPISPIRPGRRTGPAGTLTRCATSLVERHRCPSAVPLLNCPCRVVRTLARRRPAHPSVPEPVAAGVTVTPALAGAHIAPRRPAHPSVRENVARRAYEFLSTLGTTKRVGLGIRTFLKLGQIIAYSVVLGVTWRDRERGNADFLQTYLMCARADRPALADPISGQVVRLAIVLPMSFVFTLMPPRGRSDETPEEAEARESRRVFGSPRSDAWVRRLGDILALFNLAWFLLVRRWCSGVLIPPGQCRALG